MAVFGSQHPSDDDAISLADLSRANSQPASVRSAASSMGDAPLLAHPQDHGRTTIRQRSLSDNAERHSATSPIPLSIDTATDANEQVPANLQLLGSQLREAMLGAHGTVGAWLAADDPVTPSKRKSTDRLSLKPSNASDEEGSFDGSHHGDDDDEDDDEESHIETVVLSPSSPGGRTSRFLSSASDIAKVPFSKRSKRKQDSQTRFSHHTNPSTASKISNDSLNPFADDNISVSNSFLSVQGAGPYGQRHSIYTNDSKESLGPNQSTSSVDVAHDYGDWGDLRRRSGSHTVSSAYAESQQSLNPQQDTSYHGSNSNELFPAEPLSKDDLLKKNLHGKSLMLFGPESKLRLLVYKLLLLPGMETFILCLIITQLVLICYSFSNNVENYQNDIVAPHLSKTYGAFIAIFIIYSAELFCKILVVGFFFDHDGREIQHSVSTRSIIRIPRRPISVPVRRIPGSNFKVEFAKRVVSALPFKPMIKGKAHRTFSSSKPLMPAEVNFIAERAFLRNSWDRVDLVAVVFFWISMIANANGWETRHQWYVFQMIASLRILRLLNITQGCADILRSMKLAAPLLATVSLFISFFWLIFSIVGVQSFKSSARRQCVWSDPTGIQDDFASGIPCGSQADASGVCSPYYFADGTQSTYTKGFCCTYPAKCISDPHLENDYSYNNTVGFDNIFYSIQSVFVLMSCNTWSTQMYDMMMTDYEAGALFFICGIVILTFWLVNLLVAVIASSFHLVREERGQKLILKSNQPAGGHVRKTGFSIKIIEYLYQAFLIISLCMILVDILSACFVTEHSSEHFFYMRYTICVVTALVLLFEILFRFVIRPIKFFRKKTNIADTILAIINAIIVIPAIYDNNSEVYRWLTFFQVARFYRIVYLIVPARRLWLRILKNFKTTINLTIFYFLLSFFCSALAIQLLRGVETFDSVGSTSGPSYETFYSIVNSFLGMYIISTTENWTDYMYPAIESAPDLSLAVCYGIFFVCWFILSNTLVVNMFIAVINENLEDSKLNKRWKQYVMFVRQLLRKDLTHNNFGGGIKSLLNVVRGKSYKPDDSLASRRYIGNVLTGIAAQLESPDDDQVEDFDRLDDNHQLWLKIKAVFGVLRWKRFIKKKSGENPFESPFDSIADERVIRSADYIDRLIKERATLQDRRKEYLSKHPTHDRSVFLFNQDSPVRLFCQKIVEPSYGSKRTNGVEPVRHIWFAFSIFMIGCTLAMVIIVCINTPIRLYIEGPDSAWQVYFEIALTIVFTVEAAIKIIADGFLKTPNAYLKSSWNMIDLMVLLSLYVNLAAEVRNLDNVSRYLAAFKAFRALRLLTLSRTAKKTFEDMVIAGIGKIMAAALVSCCLLFPFTVWGLTLFAGRLHQCNDDNVPSQSGASSDPGWFGYCVGEYSSNPSPASTMPWDVWAPRAVYKDYFDYDSFGHALMIQFGVISLEGWVDVMNAIMSITGDDTNPVPFASSWNAIFSIFYNILATIFILTLFVSVIIKNYRETRGTAFLTDDQLMHFEQQKILAIVRPIVREPSLGRVGTIIQQSIIEETWFYRIEQFILALLAIGLVMDYAPSNNTLTGTYMNLADASYLLTTISTGALLVTHCIKLFVLKWKLFISRRWDVYGLFVSTVFFVLSIVSIVIKRNSNVAWIDTPGAMGSTIDSLFVLVLILWIPHSKALRSLFNTATASAVSLANLLLTWFVMFLVFAIALNQVFGMTKMGENTTVYTNFRTVPRAMILLFRFSCGEGWNQLLADFLIEEPNCQSGAYLASDCGSPWFAYLLFVSWNILSMYIFVNMFVSLIYENFHYLVLKRGNDEKHREFSEEEIEEFQRAWQYYDPHATGYVEFDELKDIVVNRVSGYFHLPSADKDFPVREIMAQVDFSDLNNFSLLASQLNQALKGLGPEYRLSNRFFRDVQYLSKTRWEKQKGKIPFSGVLSIIPLYKPSKYAQVTDDMSPEEIDTRMRRVDKSGSVLTLENYLVHSMEVTESCEIYYRKKWMDAPLGRFIFDRWSFVKTIKHRSKTEVTDVDVSDFHFHDDTNELHRRSGVPSIRIDVPETP